MPAAPCAAALAAGHIAAQASCVGAVTRSIASGTPDAVTAAGGAVDYIAASGTGGCGGIRVRVRIGFGRGPSDGVTIVLILISIQAVIAILFVYTHAGCAISGSFTHIAERISIVALGAFAGVIAGRAFSVVISGIVGADAALV